MATLEALTELAELGIEEPNLNHIRESYLRQVANCRPFTAKKKRKSDVAMTTAKWYRQKGTGRARQGEKSNPHMYKGGRAFPPRPRLQLKKLNKQVRRSALRSAVLAHLRNGSAWQITGADFDGFAKTKQVAAVLKSLSVKTVTLVVNDGVSAILGSRNLPQVRLITPERVNVRDLVETGGVVFTASALERYKQLLSGQNSVPAVDGGAE
jgi:large subunit ribosomal protein L4